MPRTFEIGLPDQSQREKILRLQLRNEEIKSDFDFVELSRTTQNYSGSDLKELCRAALMIPLREHLETIREDTYTCAAEVHPNIRPLSMTDIEEAITMVQPTGATAYAYEENQNRKEVAPPSYLRINSDIFDAIVTSGLQRMMQLPRNDN
jgi:SpoVK/Ycf46/Vps4 family AAA+-type ATPase